MLESLYRTTGEWVITAPEVTQNSVPPDFRGTYVDERLREFGRGPNVWMGMRGGRQSQVILSQSLCTKKWEGLGGKQNSFIICVYTRSNQPDFCAVIHPKITWNQIGTFHFFLCTAMSFFYSADIIENIDLQPDLVLWAIIVVYSSIMFPLLTTVHLHY